MSNTLVFIDEDGNPHEDELFLWDFLDDFHKLITRTNYSVYSLTGDWGSGKTSFIKIWENEKLKDFHFIHIDAFEMDYLTDPFIMFIKHFNDYLKKKKKIDPQEKKEFIDKAKKIAKITRKSIGKTVINLIATKTIGKENLEKMITEIYEGVFDKFVENTEPVAELYQQLRKAINKILENEDEPLYIIIDELDRCRPSFALEVIEKIKHIFLLPKIKFILIMNEKVLESMIEREYNLKNEGHKYLQKFIEKRIPYEPNLSHLGAYLTKRIIEIEKTFRHISSVGFLLNWVNKDILTDLQKQFGISLRDFDNLFSNFTRYGKYSTEEESITIFSLEILNLVDKGKYSSLEDYVILNDFKSDDNQNIHLLSKIISLFKRSLPSNEMHDYIGNYFNHKYD